MVDDAHGEGVLGRGGRGIVDQYDLHGKVDVEVGTLSKAFGVVGGVVAGNPLVVEWLRQRGRPFLFSSAMTIPDTAACLAALDLLEESTELVDRLWENARYFKTEMKSMGFETGKSTTPITPVMLGEAPIGPAVQPGAFRKWRFWYGYRFPHCATRQSPHPGDDLGLAPESRPGSGPGGFAKSDSPGCDPVADETSQVGGLRPLRPVSHHEINHHQG